MATKLCGNEDLKRWLHGPDAVCDGDFDKCKYTVTFGDNAFCVYPLPHITVWEHVRDQAGCLGCKYYTKKLTSAVCEPCLCAETRINFIQRED